MSFKYSLLHKNILINITKILEYLDYWVTFWNKHLSNLSDFHCFLLHKKIPNALLLKADIICSNYSVTFCLF